MDAGEIIAERKIQEAIEAGAFDNLPGKGKPLDLDESSYEDPSLRMAHRLLRANGFAPPWIEEARAIDRLRENLRMDLANARLAYAANPPRWQREFGELRRRADCLNRRILSYNLQSPAVRFQRIPFNLELELKA